MRLAFQPLFFLPRRALCWAYDQAYAEHLMDTPFAALFITIDRGGIWFPYKGDEVLWTWPWSRRERKGDNRGKAPFISIGFSGNGEFGDARFWTLKELDQSWEEYENACREISDRESLSSDTLWTMVSPPIAEIVSRKEVMEFVAAEDVKAGDLVAIDENNQVRKAT